jgi:hypothetical protein
MMAPKVGPSTYPSSLNPIYARLVEKLSPSDAQCIIPRLANHPTQTRNSQILALLSIRRDEFQYMWSHAEVGRILAIDKGIVHRVCSQAMREVRHDTGISPILQRDHETEVTSSFQDDYPFSPKQVRWYASDMSGKDVSVSWTWRLVSRYPGPPPDHCIPQDSRMHVTKDMWKIHVQNLERYVQNVPTELILNLDEVSSQEWSDRRKREVIIRHQASPRRIEYSLLRKERHISCITTISTAGDVLMLLLVIHQKMVDDVVWEDR